MHERHRHCTLADSGGKTLRRAMSYISCSEQTGHIGFKIVGTAIKRPSRDGLTPQHQVGSGEEVAGLIARNSSFHGPFRVGRATDANEKPMSLDRLLIAGLAISQF